MHALTLEGSSVEFEADGLLARAIQHELDHTLGILYIDRAVPEDRMDFSSDIQRLIRPVS